MVTSASKIHLFCERFVFLEFRIIGRLNAGSFSEVRGAHTSFLEKMESDCLGVAQIEFQGRLIHGFRRRIDPQLLKF